MTLLEISGEYRHAAQLLSVRLRQLRRAARAEMDREKLWHLQRRIAELTPLLLQTNELAEETARYYERSYHGNEKYHV